MKLIITELKYVVGGHGVPGRYDLETTEFTEVKNYTFKDKFLLVEYEDGNLEGVAVAPIIKYKYVKE